MMMLIKRDRADELGDILALWLYFLEEEEDKVKQKYDTPIHECICSSRDSGDTSDTIEWSWEKSKYAKSDTNSEEHEKMERIESLTSRDRESDDRYDQSWDDEENLKQCHGGNITIFIF
jgi:hypothetical protein